MNIIFEKKRLLYNTARGVIITKTAAPFCAIWRNAENTKKDEKKWKKGLTKGEVSVNICKHFSEPPESGKRKKILKKVEKSTWQNQEDVLICQSSLERTDVPCKLNNAKTNKINTLDNYKWIV